MTALLADGHNRASDIDIVDVSVTYTVRKRSVKALSNVSLKIRNSTFVALVGPSGCGKSTLLNVVGGLVAPTTGDAYVNGEAIVAPDPDRGVVFQHYALFPWLTVEANLEFGLRIQGVSKAERQDRIEKYLDMVGLAKARHSYPKELSGGMRQRCSIARALIVEPSVLLMDEPFGALDAITRRQLQGELMDLYTRERKTILFVTHDVEEAIFLASEVVIMGNGSISRILEIPERYPRSDELRSTPEFLAIRDSIWSDIGRLASARA